VVKVADFGLARAVEASSADDSGQLMATVAYVAPELVTDGHADARTDVYSAGIVLFEMVTGRVPYDGEVPVEVAWQHVDNDVPAPSSVVKGLPGVLDDLVARATRRDPGARPTDAGALLAEVQVVRDDLGAANVETALLRQVPARHAMADATTVVPAFQALPGDRPTWARLPEQPGVPRRYSTEPVPLLTRMAEFLTGGDRRRLLMLGAIALMVFVIAGSTWYVTTGRYTQAPNLQNMTKVQAEAAARTGGFELQYADGAFNETVPKDTVLTQDPDATQQIVKGGTITLTLSLGQERYPVPDLSGVELSAAKGQLDTVKLKLKEGTGQYSDTVPQGVVISSDPKADTPLKPGSTVTVVVSKGRAPITVPDLTNKNINDVRGQLQQLGLNVVEQYKDSDQPADTVIGQSPKAGTGVAKDDVIKLDVSKGPTQIALPDLTNQPCQQAQQALEGLGLKVRVDFGGQGVVHSQQPGPGTQVAPQSEVAIQCF
jgi:serine/threonine-protein kinase